MSSNRVARVNKDYFSEKVVELIKSNPCDIYKNHYHVIDIDCHKYKDTPYITDKDKVRLRNLKNNGYCFLFFK